ncbi:MAG: hypothetical protein QW718_00910, partial [Nitrososphaerota archaeon]
FFIFSNSLAGLLARTERMHVILQNQILLLLLPIVVISAIVGGHIGSRMLSREKVKKIIGAILTGIGLFIAFYQ